MISCILRGQMGNQMFIVATVIAHALRNGVDYAFPRTSGKGGRVPFCFPHLPQLDRQLGNVYAEKQFGIYEPIPFADDTMLDGFWQSELYFKDYRTQVLKAFNIPRYPKADTVSVHVRRGNYVNMPDRFPPVTLGYLNQAIEMFPDKKFLFFSDDMPWCRQHFRGERYSFSEGRDKYEDMGLMASCSSHIIANSSFSWMAAWIDESEDKIVVSPSRHNWVGPRLSELSTQDLIPTKWIQIKF